jgi:hypothetical protein
VVTSWSWSDSCEAGGEEVAQQRCLTPDDVAVEELGCRNEVAGSGRSRNRKVVK